MIKFFRKIIDFFSNIIRKKRKPVEQEPGEFKFSTKKGREESKNFYFNLYFCTSSIPKFSTKQILEQALKSPVMKKITNSSGYFKKLDPAGTDTQHSQFSAIHRLWKPIQMYILADTFRRLNLEYIPAHFFTYLDRDPVPIFMQRFCKEFQIEHDHLLKPSSAKHSEACGDFSQLIEKINNLYYLYLQSGRRLKAPMAVQYLREKKFEAFDKHYGKIESITRLECLLEQEKEGLKSFFVFRGNVMDFIASGKWTSEDFDPQKLINMAHQFKKMYSHIQRAERRLQLDLRKKLEKAVNNIKDLKLKKIQLKNMNVFDKGCRRFFKNLYHRVSQPSHLSFLKEYITTAELYINNTFEYVEKSLQALSKFDVHLSEEKDQFHSSLTDVLPKVGEALEYLFGGTDVNRASRIYIQMDYLRRLYERINKEWQKSETARVEAISEDIPIADLHEKFKFLLRIVGAPLDVITTKDTLKTSKKIRKCYHKKARRHHPDKTGKIQMREMANINIAHDLLQYHLSKVRAGKHKLWQWHRDYDDEYKHIDHNHLDMLV